MQEQHASRIRNLQGIHNQELEAKDKEISRMNTCLKRLSSGFRLLREMFENGKNCVLPSLHQEMIESS